VRSADFSESDMSTIRFAKPDDAAIVSSALSSPSHCRFLIGRAVIAAGACGPLRQGVFSVRAGEHFNVF
jgi:hypothetical protein